jgi:hypothetical protein
MTFGLGSFAGTIAGAVAENSGTGPMFTMLAVVAVGLLAAMLVVAADAERRRREIIAARTESAAAGS